MTCPSCLTTLSGFGADEATNVNEMPEGMVNGIKNTLGALILGPLVGSVLASAVGAIAWKDHRVIGGVLGFFGGGIIGGLVGSLIAKRSIEQDVLPALDQMAADAGELPMFSTDGGVPNSAGPLKITGFQLPATTVLPVVSQVLGVSPTSATARVTQALITSTSKSPTTMRMPVLKTTAAAPAPAPAPTNMRMPVLKTPAPDPSSAKTTVSAGMRMPVLRT